MVYCSKAKSSRGPDSGQGSIEVPAGGGGHPSSEDGPVNTPTSSNSSSCSAGLNKKSSPESRSQKSSSTTSAYDVFLGGSCNPTTWRQVWSLTQFFSVSFCKKSLICLEGKSMTPCRGDTIILFRSSQQLPRLRLGPLTRLVRCFRNYRDTRPPSGVPR